MGITAIKHITNNSAQSVYIHNHENPSNSITVNPNSTGSIDIWIPWCASQSDWQGNHYLSVEQPGAGRTLCWVWQQDDFVRYCTDGQFHNEGTPVPGVAQIDADRLLTINTDESIVFMPDLILPGDYRTLAGSLLQVLMGWFNPLCGVVGYPWQTTGWWNSANAMEAMIDYAMLTGSSAYNGMLATIFNAYKGSGFLNTFYDDEGWWGLAWTRAYDLTGIQDYLAMAEAIFVDMAGGWNPICNGGLPQQKGTDQRNNKAAIQNELYIALAARLALRGNNPVFYTGQGQQCWDWFKASGMIGTQPDSNHNMVLNLVNNGLVGCSTSTTGCCNDHGTIWTYNQGVLIGGLADLWRVTGDSSQLQMAHDIAKAAITSNSICSLVNPQGILQEPCEATNSCDKDQTQFKGIFMRNLAHLNEVDPRPLYRSFILANADSIIFHDRTNANACGLHWAGPLETVGPFEPPTDVFNASLQSSALDALNAAIPFAWSAAFVSQNVPTTLTIGQSAQVSVTMRNTGSVTWSASQTTPPVRLGSQAPQDNTTWNSGRVDVPIPVAPGMAVTFTFTIRAPLTNGNYVFQWRMVQETVTWFGDFTAALTINVTGGKEKEKEHKEKDKDKEKEKDGREKPHDNPLIVQPPSLPPGSQESTTPASGEGQAFIQPHERPAIAPRIERTSAERDV